MVDIRIAQEVPAVKTEARQEVIYRAAITGRICRAFVLHEGDDMLKVQGEDYRGDPRWIQKSDVVSYIMPTPLPTPPAIAQDAILSQKNGHPRGAAPTTQFPIGIKRQDAAKILDRYSHLAAERHCRLEGNRIFYRVPLVDGDSAREIAKSERAYDRVAHHVARLEAMERGEQPAPWVQPSPMLALPAMWKAANAWLQLQAWRGQPTPVLAGLRGLLIAMAVQALVQTGKAAFGLAPLLTIQTKDALAQAIGDGILRATQDVTGRSPIYYVWAA